MSRVSRRPPSLDQALETMVSAHSGRARAQVILADSTRCRWRGSPWPPVLRGEGYSGGGSPGGVPGLPVPMVGGAPGSLGYLCVWVSRHRGPLWGEAPPASQRCAPGGGTPGAVVGWRVAVGLHRRSARRAAAGGQWSGQPNAGEGRRGPDKEMLREPPGPVRPRRPRRAAPRPRPRKGDGPRAAPTAPAEGGGASAGRRPLRLRKGAGRARAGAAPTAPAPASAARALPPVGHLLSCRRRRRLRLRARAPSPGPRPRPAPPGSPPPGPAGPGSAAQHAAATPAAAATAAALR